MRGASSAWLKKVKALEAATKAKQQQEKQQQQQQQRQGQQEPRQSGATHVQQQGGSRPDGADADAEMLDVSAEAVLQAVSQLRGDQEYLDELCRYVSAFVLVCVCLGCHSMCCVVPRYKDGLTHMQ